MDPVAKNFLMFSVGILGATSKDSLKYLYSSGSVKQDWLIISLISFYLKKLEFF